MSVYSFLKSEKPIFHNIFPEMLKTDRYDQLPGNQNALSFFLNPKKKCSGLLLTGYLIVSFYQRSSAETLLIRRKTLFNQSTNLHCI